MKNLFLLILLLITETNGFAGPPMITDDPGTPGDRKWEINIAATGEFGTEETSGELPLLDINYGVGPNIQLKYEVPFEILKSGDSQKSEVGVGDSNFGVKWRFYEKPNAGFGISTCPQIITKSPIPKKWRYGISETGSSILLPVESEWAVGRWKIGQDFGYKIISREKNQIFYGVLGSFEISSSLEVLAELHGESFDDFSDDRKLLNLGAVLELAKWISFQVSGGRVISEFEGMDRSYLAYAGIQILL